MNYKVHNTLYSVTMPDRKPGRGRRTSDNLRHRVQSKCVGDFVGVFGKRLEHSKVVASQLNPQHVILRWHGVRGYVLTQTMSTNLSLQVTLKGKGSPYSTAECRVPELIPVLGSQPAGDTHTRLTALCL